MFRIVLALVILRFLNRAEHRSDAPFSVRGLLLLDTQGPVFQAAAI